jgi:tetratricopeptide (TPR) repeat protein
MKLKVLMGLFLLGIFNTSLPAIAQQNSSVSDEILVSQANARTFYERALELYRNGDYAGAIQNVDQAINFNSSFGEAYALRGLARYSSTQYAEAINDYTQAIRLLSNGESKARAFYNRGIAYSAIDNIQQAVSDLTDAIRLNPNNQRAFEAEAYYKRGFILSESNGAREALNDFTKAIEFNGEYLSAYAQRGLTLLGYFGDRQAAVRDFLAAIKLDPQNDAESFWNRGAAQYALGNLQAAVGDFDQAIRLNSDYVRPYSSRAAVRALLVQFDDMVADFQEARKVAPNSWVLADSITSAVLSLSNLALGASQENQDTAFQLLSLAYNYTNTAIEEHPDSSFLYLGRGQINLQFSRPVDALSDFSRVLVLEPDYAMAYYLRGIAHYQRQNLRGSLADFNRAIQISPNFADAYLYKGSIRLELNDGGGRSDIERAISMYSAVLRLNPSDAFVYEQRGFAYKLIDNERQADADFAQAASLYQRQGNELAGLALAAATSEPIVENTSSTILETSGVLVAGGQVLDDGSLFQEHTFNGTRGQSVVITLVSNEFDAYLSLRDSSGQEVAQNDDISDTNLSSQISVVLPKNDTYIIWANAYDSNGQGSYLLTVRPQVSGSFILQASGNLDTNSALTLAADNSLYQLLFFEGRKGQAVVIEMISGEFDPYLSLMDPDGNEVAQNDDISVANTNAQITAILPKDGIYSIFANAYDSSGRGQYTLTVR